MLLDGSTICSCESRTSDRTPGPSRPRAIGRTGRPERQVNPHRPDDRGGSTRCPRGDLDTVKWEPSHLPLPLGEWSAVCAASSSLSERIATAGQASDRGAKGPPTSLH